MQAQCRRLVGLPVVAFVLAGIQAAGPAAEHTRDSLDEVKQRLKDASAVLVDVREQKEWDAGHLDDARLVPLSRLKKGIDAETLGSELPKEKIIYCHCAGGVRCLPAADILKQQGYDVRPLKAGYKELLAAGFLICQDEQRADLLDQFLEDQRLELFQELLEASGPANLEPVELVGPTADIHGRKFGPAWRIPSEDQTLTVVLAKVRPPRPNNTGFEQEPPRAAFLFGHTGRLIASFGGRLSPGGSPDFTDVVNLGPVEDWFVRVMGFEKNPPFDFRTAYYRIAEKPVESLAFFAYPNGNPWSYGPEPVIRYGQLMFNSLNGPALPFGTLGMTAEQIPMPRVIIWDAENNRFRGAASETVDSRPLYRVDTKWSREFEPIERKPQQLLALGGTRGPSSIWGGPVLVPRGTEAVLILRLPDADGKPAREAATKTLAAGIHYIELHAVPDERRTEVRLWIDQVKTTFDLAGVPAAEQPKAPPIVRLLDPAASMTVAEVELTGAETRVSLTVRLP